MIKHIVMLNVRGETEEERNESAHDLGYGIRDSGARSVGPGFTLKLNDNSERVLL